MNVSNHFDSPARFWAHQAVKSKDRAAYNLAEARRWKADGGHGSADLALMHVRFARAWNHQVVSYLRIISQIAEAANERAA